MDRPLERADPSGSPYRTPGERPSPPEPKPEDDLGPERSVHRARIGRALVLPGFLVVTILAVGAAMVPALGWTALGIVLPFAAAGGAVFAIGPLRLRNVCVILHQRGLVVSSRRTRDVISFSAVRDVWWDGLSAYTYGASIAGLRLVDEHSRRHLVPLGLERADEGIENQDRGPNHAAGADGVKAVIASLHSAFSDFRLTIEDVTVAGAVVWTRNVATGTHDGPFMGNPPTGRSIRIDVFDVLRVVDGKIVEHWGVPDRLGVLIQIGALGPPAPQAAGRG